MKQASKILFLLCISLLLSSVVCLSDQVLNLIDEREKIVAQIASKAQSLFDNRYQAITDCECTMHACTFEPFTDKCHSELGSNKKLCGETCPGQKLNYAESFIFTPSGTDPANLSPEMKESICTFAGLEEDFVQLYPQVFAWTYIGTTDGLMRLWPAQSRDHSDPNEPQMADCRPFDPRVRPWFIAASTGPKDVVFVIDRSGSMAEEPPIPGIPLKWDATRNAVKTVIDTLSTGDFTNIVLFSDEAEALWASSALAATSTANKETLKDQLDTQVAQGGTNFDSGFKLAFDLLTNACSNETRTCSGCEKVIIFLTDGKDTSRSIDGGIKPSEMSARIEEYQKKLEDKTGKRASIFTFSMGRDADDSIPRQIACNNDGSWSYIDEAEDPLIAMRSYYLFFASRKQSLSPVWTEPYTDDLGLGSITTVAVPVYSSGSKGVDGVFLGVIGHDVILSDLGAGEDEINEVLLEFVERAYDCTPAVTNPCQLQVLRNVYANNAACIDRFPIEPVPSTVEESPQCFTDGGSYYKRFSKQVTWDEARELCEEDGGLLVSIAGAAELSFVANMALDDGTWIGAKRDLITFSWEDRSGTPDLDVRSEFWGIGQPSRLVGTEDCVSVDTRGPTGNLDSRDCSSRLAFICEYKTDETCVGKIKNPRDEPEGYFTTPPAEICVNAEDRLAQLEPLIASQSLNSSTVLCPLGEKRDDKVLLCCDECLTDEERKANFQSLSNPPQILTDEGDVDSDEPGDGDSGSDDSVVIALCVVIGVLGIVVVILFGVVCLRPRAGKETTDQGDKTKETKSEGEEEEDNETPPVEAVY